MSAAVIVLTGAAPARIELRDDAPVEIAETPARIDIAPTGERGPQGPAGVSYTHLQPAAAITWTINHNLGFRPAISLFTVGGVEFDAAITHISDNQAVVSLAIPTAGAARCQ